MLLGREVWLGREEFGYGGDVFGWNEMFGKEFADVLGVQCFKTDDQLIVAYSMTPAFG